jgi:hypothetical protein
MVEDILNIDVTRAGGFYEKHLNKCFRASSQQRFSENFWCNFPSTSFLRGKDIEYIKYLINV